MSVWPVQLKRLLFAQEADRTGGLVGTLCHKGSLGSLRKHLVKGG